MRATTASAETTSAGSIWRKRFLSLISVGYLALMCWFSYLAIFYEFSVTNSVLFCLTLCVVSFAALSAMLYSRFQILTRLTGILLLPAILPQILLCFGQWELILPIAVTSLIIFSCPVQGKLPRPYSVSYTCCCIFWGHWHFSCSCPFHAEYTADCAGKRHFSLRSIPV